MIVHGTEGEDYIRVGAWIITPGMVKAEMEIIKSGSDFLASQIAQTPNLSASFIDGFKTFKTNWDGYYQEYIEGFVNWWARGFKGVWDMVKSYKKQLRYWQLMARQGGVPMPLPSVLPAEKPSIAWKWVAGIGVVGGLFVVYKLLQGRSQ